MARQVPPPPRPLDRDWPRVFARRVAALLVDLTLLATVLLAPLGMLAQLADTPDPSQPAPWLALPASGGSAWVLLAALSPLAYDTLAHHLAGATLGKRLFGFVLRHEGELPDLGTAALRTLVKWVLLAANFPAMLTGLHYGLTGATFYDRMLGLTVHDRWSERAAQQAWRREAEAERARLIAQRDRPQSHDLDDDVWH